MNYDRIDRKVFKILDARKTAKVCSCGKRFDSVPENARFSDDPDLGGYFWECECRSTLYVPCRIADKVSA